MNLETYQPLARRTMKEMAYLQHVEHMSLGVNSELGEICDALKKFFVYGKGVDPSGKKDANGQPVAMKVEDGGVIDLINLAEEGGDAFWYIVGFLPELDISPAELESAFRHGLGLGQDWTYSANRLITQMQAQAATVTLQLQEYHDGAPPTVRLAAVQVMGRNMGMLYGFFGLDLEASLATNIAKLAKRYGDKYSDAAGLNRDTAAERVVLEKGLGAK